jgi:hypothetical protein
MRTDQQVERPASILLSLLATMGNASSYETNQERFLKTAEFITHPSLQRRLRNISEKELLYHLGKFAIETPCIDTYWISVMQKQGVIDWSDIPFAVAKCVEDMARYEGSMGYVEALINHIVRDAQKEGDQRARKGVNAIIDLACGVDLDPECWKRNDPTHPRGFKQLHRLAAEAVDCLDHSFDLHSDPIGVGRYSEARDLYYGAFGIYERVEFFLLEGCVRVDDDFEEDYANDDGIGVWNPGWEKGLDKQLGLDFDSD